MKQVKNKPSFGMRDMTNGNPYRIILLFSIPLLLGNIFQQLYNMVDSIVVGNYIGDQALAAVGTGFPIIFLLVSLFTGFGIGATIMISQYYGAKDFKRVKNTVSTIYTSCMIGSIPITIIGILVARPILSFMKVPDDGTLEMATTYIMVVFVGMVATIGFNVNAGILQGFGDSRTSLLFLAIAAIINIVLDLVFVIVFSMGVFGVALATVIAQFVSWLYGVYFINKHYNLINIKIFSFHFNKELFKQTMRLGIPAGIQQALFSIGVMFMQSLVNGYGSSFMAGFNGASKIDTFAFMPIQSYTNALITYTGQNIGANKLDRVKSGMRAGMVLSIGTSIIIGLLMFPFAGNLISLFTKTPEAISSGVVYLQTVLPFYSLLAVLFMFNSVIRGAGATIIPVLITLTSLWFVRIPIAYLLDHFFGRDYMFYSYGIGWLLGAILSGIYYFSGKWKDKSIIRNTES